MTTIAGWRACGGALAVRRGARVRGWVAVKGTMPATALLAVIPLAAAVALGVSPGS
jgi:hypothetical protein